MSELHQHLSRLLSEAGVSADAPPSAEAWQRLLAALEQDHAERDAQRAKLEESVTEFSNEMVRLNLKVEAERDRMRILFESAPIGMMRRELDGRISMVNPALARMLGYTTEEVLSCDPTSLLHPDDRLASSAALARGWVSRPKTPITLPRRFLHKSGATVHTNLSISVVVDAQGAAQFAIVVVEDISEKTRLELELRHAQKLESVGRLAAGVAHEINTPIQFVGDNAEFLRGGFSDLLALCETYRAALDRLGPQLPDAERAALDEATRAADFDYLRTHAAPAFAATLAGVDRVARIVRAMKSFAAADQKERAPADVNSAILNSITVGAHELGSVADVVTSLQPLPPLVCNIGDLNQVFLNLLVNAAHAIADVVGTSGARGTINVRTFLQDQQVVIAVVDTGPGVPEAIRGRIFEPFFTTKEVGRGSGQGLAICRAVVERHAGTLTFDTEVGKGSTFWVRLPLASSSAQAA